MKRRVGFSKVAPNLKVARAAETPRESHGKLVFLA